MSAPFDPQATPITPVPAPLQDPTAPPAFAPPPVFASPPQPTAAVPPQGVPAQAAPFPPAPFPPAMPASFPPAVAMPTPPPVPSGPTPSLFDQPSVWNQPPPARRGRRWMWAIALVPFLLLGLCAYGSVKLGLNKNNTLSDNSNNGRPYGQPPPALSNAFDQTTAASYPQGLAGIEVPTATAVPGFTADEVKADLDKVRQLLILGRTDEKLMTGHDVSALIAMYAKDSRADVQADFDKNDFLSYATLIAKGQSYSGIVRDKGTITFEADTGSKGGRILKVTANFVWVYGFLGHYDEPGDHLVSLREQTSWRFFSTADYDVAKGDMYLYQSDYFGYNIDCALFKGGFLALGQPTTAKPGATGDPNKEFSQVLDPGTSMGTFTNSC